MGQWIYEERKGKSENTFLLIVTILKIQGNIQRENVEKNTVNDKLEEHQHLVSGYLWESPRMKVKKFKVLKESEEKKPRKKNISKRNSVLLNEQETYGRIRG